MISDEFDEDTNRNLTPQLRALHALPSTAEVTMLRARILAAAAQPLAARARQTMRAMSRPTWLDVTSGFSRVAIPLSLAAAVLAMVVVRQFPDTARDDTTLAFAADAVEDVSEGSSVADLLRLPEDADAILLAPADAK